MTKIRGDRMQMLGVAAVAVILTRLTKKTRAAAPRVRPGNPGRWVRRRQHAEEGEARRLRRRHSVLGRHGINSFFALCQPPCGLDAHFGKSRLFAKSLAKPPPNADFSPKPFDIRR